ncbi:MAG: YbeD family protein [Pseudomarimonas sp.]
MSASIQSQPHGFQFPGTIEISVMGAADAGLERLLLSVLTDLGLAVDITTLRQRASAKGNYIAVAISFEATSRADYDAAHAALRACPEVKWTI